LVVPSNDEYPDDIVDSLKDQKSGSAGLAGSARGVGTSRRLCTGFDRWAKMFAFPMRTCLLSGKMTVGTDLSSGGIKWRGVVSTLTKRKSDALLSAWMVPITSFELGQRSL
jgi:hypothetical protein